MRLLQALGSQSLGLALAVKNPPTRTKRHGFNSWVGKTLWRRAWQPIPGFLPGESHGQRCLVGYSPWVTESQAWLKRPNSRLALHIVLGQQEVRDKGSCTKLETGTPKGPQQKGKGTCCTKGNSKETCLIFDCEQGNKGDFPWDLRSIFMLESRGGKEQSGSYCDLQDAASPRDWHKQRQILCRRLKLQFSYQNA